MLYIIATPIGNKDDITLRALHMLHEKDIIFCENTQSIKKLLSLHKITYTEKKFFKFTSHDLHHKDSFIKIMKENDVCMVSEAGTPGLSDPGKLLIIRAKENNIPYTILPGASALVPAVIGSQFPTTQWSFYGFLPHKKGRETMIKKMIESDHASFFYESVHRVEKLLNQLNILKFKGYISIARELSKVFEQYYTGTLLQVQESIANNTIPLKGEFVVGIYPGILHDSFIDNNNDAS